MRIHDDHMYHGAALTQIAEHEQFTSINAVRIVDELSRSAFRINGTIGVYLKYATTPKAGSDYVFTFTKPNKAELDWLSERCDNVFVAMVCVKDRQICCISHEELADWLERRADALGHDEETTTLLVGLPKGKAFRVNMNMPRRRKVYLDKPQLVPRKRFPGLLFE